MIFRETLPSQRLVGPSKGDAGGDELLVAEDDEEDEDDIEDHVKAGGVVEDF